MPMPALSAAFRALQFVSPAQAARVAELLFFTPPRTRLTPEQREAVERARPFTVRAGGTRIAAWIWGEGGGPVVYLVHGWGSRGARLAAFVPPLLAAGYQVVTHDAPGHGASDGRLSSMPQFARTLMAVVDAVGPAAGVITHSMGGSATTLAIHWGLRIPRAVFVAPAADPPAWVGRFALTLGMRADTVARMKARSERRIGLSWEALHVPTMAYRMEVPLLIVHDSDDDVVPLSEGEAIAQAWPGAELIRTEGLGHKLVVRAPAVVVRAVEFVTRAAGAPPPDPLAGRPSLGQWLDQHLYNRDARSRPSQPWRV
jgi:pimeloyl-ACP methyl ester carboxylesterase